MDIGLRDVIVAEVGLVEVICRTVTLMGGDIGFETPAERTALLLESGGTVMLESGGTVLIENL